MNITVLKRKHITRFEPNVDLEKKEQNNVTKRVKNFEIKKMKKWNRKMKAMKTKK